MSEPVEIPVRGSDRPMLVDAADAHLFRGLVLRVGSYGHLVAYFDDRWDALAGMAHRLVLGGVHAKGYVKHRNAVPFDCRRSNLVVVNAAEHVASFGPKGASGYKGVYPRRYGRWLALITVGGKSRSLGTYDTPKEAAVAYNRAAFAVWGKHAYLNPVDEWVAHGESLRAATVRASKTEEA